MKTSFLSELPRNFLSNKLGVLNKLEDERKKFSRRERRERRQRKKKFKSINKY